MNGHTFAQVGSDWECTACGFVVNANSSYVSPCTGFTPAVPVQAHATSFSLPQPIKYIMVNLSVDPKTICECGAKKTGARDYAPGHSSWCPVAEVVN
jgi:hypothetical protein